MPRRKQTGARGPPALHLAAAGDDDRDPRIDVQPMILCLRCDHIEWVIGLALYEQTMG